jgi:hypothetical protein
MPLGALVQIISGNDDTLTTKEPEITFWTTKFKRHTHFAIESIKELFRGDVGPGKTITASIERKGDLVNTCWFEIDYDNSALQTTDASVAPPRQPSYNYEVGDVMSLDNATNTFYCKTAGVSAAGAGSGFDLVQGAETTDGTVVWVCMSFSPFYKPFDINIYELFDYIDLYIGPNMIDRHTSEWLKIWHKLTTPIGKMPILNHITHKTLLKATIIKPNFTFRIPLSFWFCTQPERALPIIALSAHKVEVKVKLSSTFSSNILKSNVNLWCDNIFLEDEERRSFSNNQHVYLIDQVQTTGVERANTTNSILLDFNHPVKELIWKLDDANDDKITNAGIKFNRQTRINDRDGEYFTTVQRHQHHTNSGTDLDEKFYIYSFALEPEKFQPSGSCNFSNYEDVRLSFDAPNISPGSTVSCYATNYNILTIKSGYAFLKFAN